MYRRRLPKSARFRRVKQELTKFGQLFPLNSGGKPLILFTRKKNTPTTEAIDVTAFRELRERSELLDRTAGVGLWEAVLHQGDAMDSRSRWTWSAEFRRLVGYDSEADFPNLVNSWSDRLHPDDVASTFTAFGGHLEDKTGGTRYDVSYRLKVRDGSYRWFRATGGCRYMEDGSTVRACGSLTDIHQQKMAEIEAQETAAEDARTIHELRLALQALADGDSSYRIAATFPAKAERLKHDFNQAAQKLGRAIGAVGATVEQTRITAEEIASGSRDLSSLTEQQASALEETAATTEELAASVKQTADAARQAAQRGSEATQAAEAGGVIAEHAVAAMARIETASHKISDIIRVIDDIAFQTNLLALNAAVEAARAGDAGKGFAVVASEVRTLAQRSSEAAKDIAALISSSNSEVQQGVKLVGEAGTQLSQIVSLSRGVAATVSEISVAASEQARGIEEMSQTVAHLDETTQKNAGLAEESAAAAVLLQERLNELSALTAAFRVDGGSPNADVVPLRAGLRAA